MQVINVSNKWEMILKTQSQPQPRWTRNASLARYLNVSAMCLWRWQRDPELNFPKPTVINKYPYTDLNQVDAWMRERVLDRTVKIKKSAVR
jgi:hypothetical protein